MEQELELVLVWELVLMSGFVWGVKVKVSERGYVVDFLVSSFDGVSLPTTPR
jgi:hypothetical protein